MAFGRALARVGVSVDCRVLLGVVDDLPWATDASLIASGARRLASIVSKPLHGVVSTVTVLLGGCSKIRKSSPVTSLSSWSNTGWNECTSELVVVLGCHDLELVSEADLLLDLSILIHLIIIAIGWSLYLLIDDFNGFGSYGPMIEG